MEYTVYSSVISSTLGLNKGFNLWPILYLDIIYYDSKSAIIIPCRTKIRGTP